MDRNYFIEPDLDDNLLGQTPFMKDVINNNNEFIDDKLNILTNEELRMVLNKTDDYGYNPLMLAIQNYKFDLALNFLQNYSQFIDLNTRNNVGDTALFMALNENTRRLESEDREKFEKNKDVIEELVISGSDLSEEDAKENNALMVAIERGTSIDTIKFLIKNMKTEYLFHVNMSGETAEDIFDQWRYKDDSDIPFEELMKQIEKELLLQKLGTPRARIPNFGDGSRKRKSKRNKRSRKRKSKRSRKRKSKRSRKRKSKKKV